MDHSQADEPMEQGDTPAEPSTANAQPDGQGKENADVSGSSSNNNNNIKQEKRTRNRSRASKSAAKIDNVNQMLAELQPEQLGPNSPPLGPDKGGLPLPNLDQPPLQGNKKKRKSKYEPKKKSDDLSKNKDDEHHNEDGPDKNSGTVTNKETQKDKGKISTTNRSASGASQRTLGRIPKITSLPKDVSVPSHNRQWTKESTETSSGTSGTSAYSIKPGGNKPVCLDITSARFIPEDDQRIAIVRRKMLGDDVTNPASDENIIIHNLPTIFSQDVTGISADKAPGADAAFDDERFISVADFASAEINQPTTFHTIAKRDAVTFLVVYRRIELRGKLSWDFPSIGLCQDFINDLLSKLYAEDVPGSGAYMRSGRWGKLQTIVVQPNCLHSLNELRRQIVLAAYRGFTFDTFPRDVVVAKPDVSILLRGSMKTFQTEIIPKVLFTRNQDIIAGSLRVLSTKYFQPGDTSHKGESKEHWRTISLKGDDQLLRCLRFIPESRPFLLGYDAVQVRGGLRPHDPTSGFLPGNKHPWSDIGPSLTPLLPSLQHLQQQQPNSFDDPSTSSSSDSMRGQNKRGRPFRGRARGRGRGRFQKQN